MKPEEKKLWKPKRDNFKPQKITPGSGSLRFVYDFLRNWNNEIRMRQFVYVTEIKIINRQ